MEETLIESAANISPLNNYVYGFLVAGLVTIVAVLWRYLSKLINEYKDINKNTIDRNTAAFEKYNQRLEDEKKKDNNHTIQLTQLIEKVSILIEHLDNNNEVLVNKIIIANKDMFEQNTKKA